MDKSEKDTLLQFMGQVYGEAKKTDQLLVGNTSPQLQPCADQIKKQFEQTLRAPVQPTATGAQPQPIEPLSEQIGAAAPVTADIVTPEQAAAELAQAQQGQSIALVPNADKTGLEEPHIPAPVVDPNQLEFDMSEPSKMDKLIDLIKRQNTILLEIRDNTIQSKHNAKRAKNTKSS